MFTIWAVLGNVPLWAHNTECWVDIQYCLAWSHFFFSLLVDLTELIAGNVIQFRQWKWTACAYACRTNTALCMCMYVCMSVWECVRMFKLRSIVLVSPSNKAYWWTNGVNGRVREPSCVLLPGAYSTVVQCAVEQYILLCVGAKIILNVDFPVNLFTRRVVEMLLPFWAQSV